MKLNFFLYTWKKIFNLNWIYLQHFFVTMYSIPYTREVPNERVGLNKHLSGTIFYVRSLRRDFGTFFLVGIKTWRLEKILKIKLEM